jgi:hypothetical protein
MGSLMDALHSQVPDLGGGASFEDDEPADDPGAGVAVSAKDERRLQVRAYNFWASLLGDRELPSIDDLETSGLPDFAPKGVLLDFTAGPDNPVIAFLGADLAEESGAPGPIRNLADVPEGTLLSRITTHYMQILDNQAPVGFEDEFVDRHGAAMVYRGILLPFCGNADRIEYVCGVINWKQVEAGRPSARADSAHRADADHRMGGWSARLRSWPGRSRPFGRIARRGATGAADAVARNGLARRRRVRAATDTAPAERGDRRTGRIR